MPTSPVPPPVGSSRTSGIRQSSCSASSSPIVFLPSRRYGSFSVERSNQSSSGATLATTRPAVAIEPSMVKTWAPAICASATAAGGGGRGPRRGGARRPAAGRGGGRRAARHDDDAGQPAPRRVHRRRAAGIAGRRDDEAPGAERPRTRERHTEAARLERPGRILAFVLPPELPDPEAGSEPRQLEEGRPSLAPRP